MMFRFKAWNFIMSFGPDNVAFAAVVLMVFIGMIFIAL
jgi:hypothetical protein